MGYAHKVILLSLKKKGNPVTTTWMSLEGVMPNGRDRSNKNKVHITSFMRPGPVRVTDAERRMVAARRGGKEEERRREEEEEEEKVLTSYK